MKTILTAAILALAPAAYASDDANMARNDGGLDAGALTSEVLPRGVGVRCSAGGRVGFGRGFAVGRSYFQACNAAAREAFSRCSGQFFRGPFHACNARGGILGRFDDFDRRQPGDRATFRACMNIRCDAVRHR